MDKEWVYADTRRLAFYNNLKPHAYKFRVAGRVGEEQWQESPALVLEQLPFFYQTWLFMLLASAAVLTLAFLAYWLRVHQITREFHVRLEERVGERTRIARDLHDTLLQTFQGVLLKFSMVPNLLRSRPDEAEQVLKSTIEQARAAITEGRNAVQGLRSSTVVTNDLAYAITTFGERLSADQTGANCPRFHVQVEGTSRDLSPLVRDEVYHVACETLRNAFRHAEAHRIEVLIRYDARQFRLSVVDNGKGIDPAVLGAGGRAGHHGLPGINERAELAGGKLSVRSRLDSGTEIDLTIPASIAYTKSASAPRSMFSRKGAG
jgi:signal transduction histidine kinase